MYNYPHLRSQKWDGFILRRDVQRRIVALFFMTFMAGAVSANAALLPDLPERKPNLSRDIVSVEKTIALPVRKPIAVSAASPDRPWVSYDHMRRAPRLSQEDAARYGHIFAFQDMGDFDGANKEIEKLDDHRLMGHVLRERLLHPEYKASRAELSGWMKDYADHPGAQKVYELALKKGVPSLPRPKLSRGMTAYHAEDTGQLAQPYMAERRFNASEKKMIQGIESLLAESPTAALKRLESEEAQKSFTKGETAALRARIAESYFYNAKPEKALEQAVLSLGHRAADVPLAGWIAGLSAWQMKDYGHAAEYFETAARSPRASAWMTSASAYWTARAYLRDRQPRKVSYWLHRAAEHPRSFYGIIAMNGLGMGSARFDWDVPDLNRKRIKMLADTGAGRRALALADAGRADFAEQELRQIDPSGNLSLGEAMIALAHDAGMPALAMRLGSGIKGKNGALYDAALYPDAPWQPRGGYEMDKALVYAFIRQESKFNPMARNAGSGATGLMQLMPRTAKHVAKPYDLRLQKGDLIDPPTNMALGQKYLAELLQHESVNNNLFKLAVAYNAGPGNLARWEQKTGYADDPLFFIEAIPAAETRIFVERVMANYWIYRLKYDQSVESLEKVAAGEWPVYVAEDIRRGPRFAAANPFQTP